MSWLLELIDGLIEKIPQDLNAEVIQENDEIEVIVLQADKLWNYGCGLSCTRERLKWLQCLVSSLAHNIDLLAKSLVKHLTP